MLARLKGSMNVETAKSLAAKALGFAGVYLMAKYPWLSSGAWEGIVGVVMAIISALYSFPMNSSAALIKAADSRSEVDQIKVNDPTIASITSPKTTLS